MKKIACDLGSNTLRIVELDSEDKNYIKTYEEVVKTADGLKTSGVISHEAIKRVLNAFENAQKKFDFSKNAKCVATEALRVAKNGNEVIEKIKNRFNIDAQIISSKDEAICSALGVEYELQKLNIDIKEYILVDLGGASTEITCKKDSFSEAEQLRGWEFIPTDKPNNSGIQVGLKSHPQEEMSGFYTHSYPFGVRILHDTCKTKSDIEKFLKPFTEKISKQVKPFTNLPLISIAGTPTLVSAYINGLDFKTYDSSKVSGTTLTVEDFTKALHEFKNMDEKSRIFYLGEGRKDVAIHGIVALINIMKTANKNETLVIDAGLAEGVALNLK